MNIFNKIKNLAYGLAYGLKITEEEILTQKGANNDDNITTNQNVDAQRMSRALLNGEETQAVQELRDRTYRVSDAASKLEYITNNLVVKKQDKKDVVYENSENLKIKLIQFNDEIVQNILDELKRVNSFGESPKFIINIERDFFPRYRLEEFSKKLVIKELEDDRVQLDFYVSTYPDEFNFKSKGFINEIKRIKENNLRSDILDFKCVKFITQKAYKVDDLLEYQFDKIFFSTIDIFDGYYVVKFKAHVKIDGVNIIEKYKMKEIDEKYNNKTKKDVIFNLSEIDNKEYICSECGKKITNDNLLKPVDNVKFDEVEHSDGTIHYISDDSITEFYDAQITLETYGRVICKKCLEKLIKEGKLS